VHPDDIAALGLYDGQIVDLISEWTDGTERTAPEFRVVSYDTPRGCAASYYPETNPLVPLDSTALGSNCPTSKSVIVRLHPDAGRDQHSEGSGDPIGTDAGHKSDVAPHHLS
jgi:formate dehydrogenase major subunit